MLLLLFLFFVFTGTCLRGYLVVCKVYKIWVGRFIAFAAEQVASCGTLWPRDRSHPMLERCAYPAWEIDVPKS